MSPLLKPTTIDSIASSSSVRTRNPPIEESMSPDRRGPKIIIPMATFPLIDYVPAGNLVFSTDDVHMRFFGYRARRIEIHKQGWHVFLPAPIKTSANIKCPVETLVCGIKLLSLASQAFSFIFVLNENVIIVCPPEKSCVLTSSTESRHRRWLKVDDEIWKA